MKIKSFFDKETATVTHLIIDEISNKCAVIDPVLDYDWMSGYISHNSPNTIIEYIKNNNLILEWILETHIHADHLTAAHYLKNEIGGKIAIGSGIAEVLKYWVPIFNAESDIAIDGTGFDKIFSDQEEFRIGELKVTIINTPGHTPACVSYLINNEAVFVGDLMFMPYVGTGRTDFPGGDSRKMYHSIQRIFSLPENIKIFTSHEYPKDGDEPKWQSTIKEQKEQNILAKILDEESYVKARFGRDQNKPVPKLLLPSIQINLRAGRIPSPEKNGISYIKIPLNSI